MYTEIFPYKMADGSWHKLCLTFSQLHVQVYIDCNKIYERALKPIDRHLGEDVEVWLGQRNSRHAYFKVSTPSWDVKGVCINLQESLLILSFWILKNMDFPQKTLCPIHV